MPDLKAPWWERERDEAHKALLDRVEEIKSDHSGWYTACTQAYSAYGDAYGLRAQRRPAVRTKRNVIAEAIDAKTSEVCQTQVRVNISSTDADWSMRDRAKHWVWYSDAAHNKHRLSQLDNRLMRDAFIAGTCFGIIVDTDDGPRPERVHPADFFLDDGGCIGVEPPEIIVRYRLSRHSLARLYPDHADVIIEKARIVDDALGRGVVEVFHGWYHDKREVVACEGIDEPLLFEEWEGRPPWFWCTPIPPTSGFRGISLVLRAWADQALRNKVSGRIQAGEHYAAVRLLVRKGAISPQHLENEAGTVLFVDGPVADSVLPLVQPAVHPELYKREAELTQAIFAECQANDMFARGEIPPSLTSGKAIMNYREVKRGRNRPILEERDAMHVQLITELMRAEHRIFERNPGYKVPIRVSGRLKNIAMDDISLDLQNIQVEAQPSNMLPTEIGGLIELLQGLVADGLIPAEEFYRMINIPDFERTRERLAGPGDLIEAQLDGMLRDGEFRTPYPYMNLEMALDVGVRALQRAELDDVPEDRLKLLRIWIDRVQAFIGPPIPPVPPLELGGPPPMLPSELGGLPPGMPPPGMPPMPPGPMPPPGMPPMPPPGIPT